MERIHIKFLSVLFAASFLPGTVSVAAEFVSIDDVKHATEQHYISGQPSEEALFALAKEGAKHVVNLRPPAETPEFNEAAIVTKLGMAYYNIPISGPPDLTQDNVKLLDKLLKQFSGDKVLIHCSTANRVGALMALRAAWINGATKEQALEEGKRYGLTRMAPAVDALLK